MIKNIVTLMIAMSLSVLAVGCSNDKSKNDENINNQQVQEQAADRKEATGKYKDWLATGPEKIGAIQALAKHYESKGLGDKLKVMQTFDSLFIINGSPTRGFSLLYYLDGYDYDYETEPFEANIALHDNGIYSIEDVELELNSDNASVEYFKEYQPESKEYDLSNKEDRAMLRDNMLGTVESDISDYYTWENQFDIPEKLIELLIRTIYDGDTEEITELLKKYTVDDEAYNSIMTNLQLDRVSSEKLKDFVSWMADIDGELGALDESLPYSYAGRPELLVEINGEENTLHMRIELEETLNNAYLQRTSTGMCK